MNITIEAKEVNVNITDDNGAQAFGYNTSNYSMSLNVSVLIAMGAKPSVGGQSQRTVFAGYPDTDCIVHFHCPMLEHPRDNITVMSQWQYECGSHECGENTRNGLRPFGNLYAVMLESHGPNIVFSRRTEAQEVIEFIKANFDLSRPTNGFTDAYF